MTLKQLRYIIEICEKGSISKAAESLFVAQPSLSKAVSDIESEMGINIFLRNNRGVMLTDEGKKFLSYARQVVEQADILENVYKKNSNPKRIFSVSSQHYAFVVDAFAEFIKRYGKSKYEFSLREMRTADIFESVSNYTADIGIIYLSNFNRSVMNHLIKTNELEFTRLFSVKPHVFMYRENPLAKKSKLTLDDLKDYPRLSFDQGLRNSFYYSEEPLITENADKNVIVSDRATLFNLLIGLNGYTISSGILNSNLNGDDIVSIPLISDEVMDVGYIIAKDRILNDSAEKYLEILKEFIEPFAQ